MNIHKHQYEGLSRSHHADHAIDVATKLWHHDEARPGFLARVQPKVIIVLNWFKIDCI